MSIAFVVFLSDDVHILHVFLKKKLYICTALFSQKVSFSSIVSSKHTLPYAAVGSLNSNFFESLLCRL